MPITIESKASALPRIFVDGRLVEQAHVWGTLAEYGCLIEIREQAAADLLRRVSIQELPEFIGHLGVPSPILWHLFTSRVIVRPQHREMEFVFSPEMQAWSGPWSISTYTAVVADVLAENHRPQLVAVLDDDLQISLTVEVSLSATIDDYIKQWAPVIDGYRIETERRLARTSDALVLSFTFAPEVKAACEQYLLYFGQFLHDVGVDVCTGLEERGAGEVLFSVTPKNSRDSLSRVCQALTEYLKLPQNELTLHADADIESLRLSATIEHLRSQISLGRALVQTQRATITAQEFTIAAQQQLLDGCVVRNPGVEREELLGGTIAVTRYEGKGFEVNLPLLLQKFRRLFGRE